MPGTASRQMSILRPQARILPQEQWESPLSLHRNPLLLNPVHNLAIRMRLLLTDGEFSLG